MPWKETHVMDQKINMISDWLSGEYSITELSRIYEVSRKTLYKWINRYEKDSGLQDRSSKPLTMPKSTPPDIIAYIISSKTQHIHWGSRKILAWLTEHYPYQKWPAASTTSEILKRHGMVKARRKRHHTAPYIEPFLNCNQPNEVWCADFKGQFKLGAGNLCYPLTLSDSYSRYLLGCWGLAHPNYLNTRSHLESAFREYGLPSAIRIDNGVPFASVALGGLSSLAVWLIKLGIKPERIEKGHPEQNGRHERMHRTLKAESINPPHESFNAQQRAFNQFRTVYNQDRPHEALGQKTPVSVYRKSSRVYPDKFSEIEYNSNFSVRRVKPNGAIKWKARELYISGTLAEEPIGLKQIDNGIWQIYYSFYPLGIIDERTFKITPNE
ncbi:MAG: integrase core domain-containing protein [Peptococcaceae bacterium]